MLNEYYELISYGISFGFLLVSISGVIGLTISGLIGLFKKF